MAKAGRKRKVGHRERNGRSQRQADYANQLAAENMAVVVDARVRHFGVTPERAKDASWGHTIGILQNRSVITAKQAQAADMYLMDYIRLHRMKGWPRINPKIAAYAQMIPGFDYGEDLDDEAIQRAQEKRDAANQAIVDNLGFREASHCLPAFQNYVLYQANANYCTPRDGGNLRTVLNALVRFYRL